MPSTYSSNLRFELIGPGEQPTTWGNTTNNNLGTLVEGAISGAIELSAWTGGDYTLSVLKGASDQARNMTLIVPAALPSTGNIVAPAVPKVYTIINKSSYDIGIKIGATTPVTILAESNKVVVSDGTVFREAETLTPATDTRIGGVIVGAGLEADATGVLDVIPATTTDIGGVIVGTGLDVAVDGTLDLTPATTSTLGGVIVNDAGLGVDGSGTLTLDAATSATPGGVIVGSTLAVSGGTINLPTVGTAGTTAYPASITTDAYGRVTATTAGSVTSGTVTNVSLSPGSIGSVTSPSTTPVITLNKATASIDGYLAAADFTTFNNKVGLTGSDISLSSGSFLTGNGNFTTTNGNFTSNNGSLYLFNGDLQLSAGDMNLLGSSSIYVDASGIVQFGILASGSNAAVYADGSGNLTLTSSDIRLKEDVAPLVNNLAKALLLNPVSYKWKPEANRGKQVEVGFIAQEVREIVPEVVGEMRNEEKHLTLDYAHLAPILTGAIQELNAKIEALTAEVEALKGV